VNQNSRPNRDLSRRQLLRYSGIGVAAAAGSSFLVACGGDDDSGGGGGGGGQQSSGGTLIHGATGGGSKDTLDPHAPVTNPDIARVSNLYEPLLFWNNTYELEPALAESVEGSKDAKTWTIKMRQGVTFHNGKDVTADDAWFSIQRVSNPKAPLSAGGQLSTILDFEASKVVDPTTLQLVLKVPYALLDSLLAEYTLGIIPTDFDIANPVGTGAFAYKSFDPGKTSTFTKYADYWGDPAFVDELQIQDFTDDSAKVNALQSGQVQTVVEAHRRLYTDGGLPDHVNRMCLTDSRLFLPGLNLAYTDRSSMSTSTEVRVPFVDPYVFQAAFSFRGAQKIRGRTQKVPLRHVAEDQVPRDVLDRPKASFGAPLRAWVTNDLGPLIDDVLLDGRLVSSGFLRLQPLRRMVSDQRSGRSDQSKQLWQLLSMELWYRSVTAAGVSAP